MYRELKDITLAGSEHDVSLLLRCLADGACPKMTSVLFNSSGYWGESETITTKVEGRLLQLY